MTTNEMLYTIIAEIKIVAEQKTDINKKADEILKTLNLKISALAKIELVKEWFTAFLNGKKKLAIAECSQLLKKDIEFLEAYISSYL